MTNPIRQRAQWRALSRAGAAGSGGRCGMIRAHPGCTLVIGPTAREPVPQSIIITSHANGSAYALAPRRRFSRRRFWTLLVERFGDEAKRPIARGRDWLAQIRPPIAVEEESDAESAAA